jgi:hypothetical protein
MYNKELVKYCQDLVNDSIKNRSQIRQYFGKNTESDLYKKFLTKCNDLNFDLNSALLNMPLNELVYRISLEDNCGKCHCGNDTQFMSVAKGYAMHCSKKCKHTDPSFIAKQVSAKEKLTEAEKRAIAAKRAATNLEKYGTEYTMHNADLVEKFKQSRKKNV